MKMLVPFLLITQIFTGSLFSQDEDKYRDLFILYIDGFYVKCIKQAEKRVTKSENENDEFPFLITAAAYFEMSKDQLYQSKYPHAYQQALKFAGVAYGKLTVIDKYKEFKNSFLSKLTMSAVKDVQYQVLYPDDSSHVQEIVATMNLLIKFNPKEPGIFLIKSVYENYTSDSLSASISYKKGMEYLNEITTIENMTQAGKLALKIGFLLYSDYYAQNGKKHEAKEILQLGSLYFAKDEEYNQYQKQYD